VAGVILGVFYYQVQKGISKAQESLGSLGSLGSSFSSMFTVSWGIGFWLCVFGAVALLIGGVMSMKGTKSQTPAA